MEWLIALLALTAMEIVLGIDNIIFIAILIGHLPEPQRTRARLIGLVCVGASYCAALHAQVYSWAHNPSL